MLIDKTRERQFRNQYVDEKHLVLLLVRNLNKGVRTSSLNGLNCYGNRQQHLLEFVDCPMRLRTREGKKCKSNVKQNYQTTRASMSDLPASVQLSEALINSFEVSERFLFHFLFFKYCPMETTRLSLGYNAFNSLE